MEKKLKSTVSSAIMLIVLFLFIPKVNAQDCGKTYANAKEQFKNKAYQNVQGSLKACLAEFSSKKKYYLKENQDQVFRVYKLSITAYYKEGRDNLADDMEDELIDYFKGVISPAKVLDRLGYTGI